MDLKPFMRQARYEASQGLCAASAIFHFDNLEVTVVTFKLGNIQHVNKKVKVSA